MKENESESKNISTKETQTSPSRKGDTKNDDADESSTATDVTSLEITASIDVTLRTTGEKFFIEDFEDKLSEHLYIRMDGSSDVVDDVIIERDVTIGSDVIASQEVQGIMKTALKIACLRNDCEDAKDIDS